MAVKTGIEELDSYCEGVLSGDIVACGWVKKAVERHYSDLEKAEDDDYPYYFEKEAAQHFFDFCELRLKHYEGLFAGKPLLLEPWQKFIYGSIFGWLKKKAHRNPTFDNVPIRRFREAIVFIPKKNGKSILSGAVALYMMDWDQWPAAQCYILAKNQTHAKDLGYRAAVKMTQADETLEEKYRVNRSAADAGIYYDDNNSFYKPITSKPESEDGRNVHFCGPDETKDWTDFDIYDVMKNGTVNAPNSLFLSTTTAGHNRESLGFQQQQYLEKVLDGVVADEVTFGIIYSIDEEDKEAGDWWADPEVWKKANPNYGVSVFEDALQSMIPAARQALNKRIAFETKHLNIWHSSHSAFLSHERWQTCGQRELAVDMEALGEVLEPYRGERAWGGLDLGAVSDFTAFVLVFEGGDVIPLFWIPADTLEQRGNASLIRPWVRAGFIKATGGDYTDYDFVEQTIIDISETVDLQEVAYDKRGMEQIATHLQNAGIEVTPYSQGYAKMSPAIDYLETCVLKQSIEHFNNPVLSWMNSNITVKKGPSETRLFDKSQSEDKIDGMVALAMALYRSSIDENEELVYDGGLTVV